jgi:ATP-binding protein involved in chromosome partitioning
MSITKEQVVEAIQNVKDPDLQISLAELDAIDSISIEENKVRIKLKLIQPIFWAVKPINDLCIVELRKLSSTHTFEILVTEKEYPKPNRQIFQGVKNIIAVASGKGGVGKSSIAANIASALSLRGAKVGVLDGDVYGPSQPTMFGLTSAKLEGVQLSDGRTLAKPNTKYGIDIASMGFMMEKEDALIVRGPMLAGYFNMLCEQIYWGDLDFLVFDLPPGTGDIQLTLTQKIPLTGAVIVTTPQEISVADVRRSISMFRKVSVDILGVVENMSYFAPDDMPDKRYYIFGEGGGKAISEEMGINFLGQVPLTMEMRQANDGGMPMVIKDREALTSQEIIKITESIVGKVRAKNYELSKTPTMTISV